jgi:hypothetical protein
MLLALVVDCHRTGGAFRGLVGRTRLNNRSLAEGSARAEGGEGPTLFEAQRPGEQHSEHVLSFT